MTNESCMTTSPRFPLAADAQSARPLHINVREAAKQLQVSTSTVYRLDRVNGPLRFISARRPIAIDQASLENYLAEASGIGIEPDLRAEDEPRPCPKKREAERIESRTPALETARDESARTSHPAPPSPSCGQRELIMPNRDRLFMVHYVVMQGMY